MKGTAISFSAHASVSSMVSICLCSPAIVLRCRLACWIRCATYSELHELRMLKKYVLSGNLPFGSLLGKYFKKSGSFYIFGQMFFTDSSSKKGTLIILISLISTSFFSSMSICLRKSFVSMFRGGTYNCTNTKIKAKSKQLTAVLEVLDEVVDAAQLARKLGCVHPASFRAEEVVR